MSEATSENIPAESADDVTIENVSVEKDAIAENTPPKKRRGRPPGSGKKTAEEIEAGKEGVNKTEKPAKRKSSTNAEQRSIMARQLVGIHKLAAMATGLPELLITDDEGTLLAHAVANVCDEYGLSVDGKTGATLQLLGTAAMIYGPRALHVMQRAQAEKKSREQNAGQPA